MILASLCCAIPLGWQGALGGFGDSLIWVADNYVQANRCSYGCFPVSVPPAAVLPAYWGAVLVPVAPALGDPRSLESMGAAGGGPSQRGCLLAAVSRGTIHGISRIGCIPLTLIVAAACIAGRCLADFRLFDPLFAGRPRAAQPASHLCRVSFCGPAEWRRAREVGADSQPGFDAVYPRLFNQPLSSLGCHKLCSP